MEIGLLSFIIYINAYVASEMFPANIYSMRMKIMII